MSVSAIAFKLIYLELGFNASGRLSDPLKQQEHDAIENEVVKENALITRQQDHKKCVDKMIEERMTSQPAVVSVPPSDIIVPI